MGLLQDPLKALDQVEWYLDNASLESFPGAFELAAGNLCRQTLEQMLFILCFFSGMPRKDYMSSDRRLRTAGNLLQSLRKVVPTSKRRYVELARRRGPRISKFGRSLADLQRWQRELNEPSHFSLRFRAIDARRLLAFVAFARSVLDEKDKYLIVAAVNELFSHGKVRAVLGDDSDNTPGITTTAVVGPGALRRTAIGGITLETPPFRLKVISATEVPRGAWPRGTVVLVQHAVGMSIGSTLVTARGTPIDLSSMNTAIHSFAESEHQARYLIGHLRRLGFSVERTRPIHSSNIGTQPPLTLMRPPRVKR
jgi:hypothetical protein